MIQQPELGKRLLALRKAVDITQEELKDQCHVSVRTIQRIESGIVTPRLSTIRILIAALGEDPGDWQSLEASKTFHTGFKGIFLIDAQEHDLRNTFQPAWVAGTVYLLLLLINIGITSLSEENSLYSPSTLIPINLLMIVALIVFMRGFLALAVLFDIHRLKISTYLYMIFAVIALISDMIEVSLPVFTQFAGVISFFTLLLIGAASLIFGISLLKLEDGMGGLAKYAGRLEIVFGLSYLSIVLSFLGLIMLGPILVLEIVLLSKADEQAKNGLL